MNPDDCLVCNSFFSGRYMIKGYIYF
jgi:hypothetical protein